MRQQHSFHRLDRSAAGMGRERPEGGSSVMMPLPPGWLCLRDCNLTGHLNQPVVVPFVLIHADVGVALVDVVPDSNPEADTILRRRLEAARFESIFPGFLPILHLALDRADLPSMETILRDAFAALPPLSVPGGDGWTSVVRRALVPRDPARAAAHSGLPTEHVERPLRHIGSAREMDTESDMLHREVTPHAAAKPSFDDDAPDSAVRASHPLPWVIMSGVGGLIAVLALFGLLNKRAETRNTAEEASIVSTPAQPTPSVAATVAPPLAAPTPPLAAPAPPTPAPSQPNSVASAPKPQPAAPPPAVAPPPLDASAAAGTSAVPSPAQRPAATAADRLPQVTVRQPANLRTGPDGQANIVRVAPRGETFRVHGRTANGWLQVGDAEPRGWLHTSRLGNVE